MCVLFPFDNCEYLVSFGKMVMSPRNSKNNTLSFLPSQIAYYNHLAPSEDWYRAITAEKVIRR